MTDQRIMDRAAEIARRKYWQTYFNLPAINQEVAYNIAAREIATEDAGKVEAVVEKQNKIMNGISIHLTTGNG